VVDNTLPSLNIWQSFLFYKKVVFFFVIFFWGGGFFAVD